MSEAAQKRAKSECTESGMPVERESDGSPTVVGLHRLTERLLPSARLQVEVGGHPNCGNGPITAPPPIDSIALGPDDLEDVDIEHLQDDAGVMREAVTCVRQALKGASGSATIATMELVFWLLSWEGNPRQGATILLNSLTYLFANSDALRELILQVLYRPAFAPVIDAAMSSDAGFVLFGSEVDESGDSCKPYFEGPPLLELLRTIDADSDTYDSSNCPLARIYGEESELLLRSYAMSRGLLFPQRPMSIVDLLKVVYNYELITIYQGLVGEHGPDPGLRQEEDLVIVEGIVQKAIGPLTFSVMSTSCETEIEGHLVEAWLKQAEEDPESGASLIIAAVCSRFENCSLLDRAFMAATAARHRMERMAASRIRRRIGVESSARETDPSGVVNEVILKHFGLSGGTATIGEKPKWVGTSHRVSLIPSIVTRRIESATDFFKWFDRRIDGHLKPDYDRARRQPKAVHEAGMLESTAIVNSTAHVAAQLSEIQNLYPAEFELLKKKYLGGMSSREVAEELRCSRQKIDRDVQIACYNLTKWLES